MRILMLGNSFTTANDLPAQLAALTGAEVVCHTRGGARLSEHLNPGTRLGARTQAALAGEHWDYVVLQEMSHGPCTSPGSFLPPEQCRFSMPPGPIRRAAPNWLPRAGTMRQWPGPFRRPTGRRPGRITPCLPRWENSSMSAPALRISTLPTASTPMPWEAGLRLKPWHL